MISKAANDFYAICIEAAQLVIDSSIRSNCAFRTACPYILSHGSWMSLVCTVGLIFDDGQPPKLLEYNATSERRLVEAAVASMYWLQTQPERDQFNSILKTINRGVAKIGGVAARKSAGWRARGISRRRRAYLEILACGRLISRQV